MGFFKILRIFQDLLGYSFIIYLYLLFIDDYFLFLIIFILTDVDFPIIKDFFRICQDFLGDFSNEYYKSGGQCIN